MKNRKDFRPFRIKIFSRTIAVLAGAAAVVYFTYAVLLQGHFADGVIALVQNAFGMEYDAALRLYEQIFRSHRDLFILLFILLVFAGLFCVYLGDLYAADQNRRTAGCGVGGGRLELDGDIREYPLRPGRHCGGILSLSPAPGAH